MAIKKPNIQKTSEEKKKKIKSISAFGLPTNPSARGMSAEAIKEAFWAPILAESSSMLDELGRVVDEINAYLETVYRHVGSGDVYEIEKAYEEFIGADESGLTGLSNATWRVLKRHVESFSANMTAVANSVAEAKGYQEAAKLSASDADAASKSAQEAANTAKGAMNAAQESLTDASLFKEDAQSAAAEAKESEDAVKAFVEDALNEAEDSPGMYLAKSLTCYAFNNGGNVSFGTTPNTAVNVLEDNSIFMGGLFKGSPRSQPVFFKPLRDGIFSSRLVEIVINEPYEHAFEDPIYYKECLGGTQTISKGIDSAAERGDDGKGEGYTRLIQARKIDPVNGNTFIYVLKLSKGLMDAIRKALAYAADHGGAWGNGVPIIFNGYN